MFYTSRVDSMSIGIITFHSANNCGSMLQSYALQQTLKKMGYKNEIIDFSNLAQRHMYALLRTPKNSHDVKYDLAALFYFSKFKRHYYDYRNFLSNHMKLSAENYSTNDKLNETNNFYDYFIAGSDQVWNICCTDADDAYFLNFVDDEKTKIAYAPSFGRMRIMDFPEKAEIYRKYLNRFDYLSTRENNGAKWIKELTNREAPVLIDPTLFLDKKDYEQLANETEAVKGKYIFYYAFSYSESVNSAVKKISERLNMPVYVMDAKWWVKSCKKFGFKLTEGSGPITFLNMILNAELVLTTSFHGTVFSILGERKFWFLNSDMHNSNDDRAETLLDMFGITDRFIDCKTILEDKISDENLLKQWNHDTAKKNLEQRRKQAIDFLTHALNDKKEGQ